MLFPILRRLLTFSIAAYLVNRLVRFVLRSKKTPLLRVDNPGDLQKTAKLFAKFYEEDQERGSQLVVYHKGKLALSAYGGRDEATFFGPDKLTTIFSCTKVVESLAVAMLCERGVLKYDDKLCQYIPGFYSSEVTLADLMKHRAGCAAILRPVTSAQAHEMLDSVEATVDFINKSLSKDFDPANPTYQRYHAITRGVLLSVVIRKATGNTLQHFVQQEIVTPLRQRYGAQIDLDIGCPPEKQSRMVKVESGGSIPVAVFKLLMAKSGLLSLIRPPATDKAANEAFYSYWLEEYECDFIAQLFLRGNLKTLTLLTDIATEVHVLANSVSFRSLPLSSSAGASNAFSLATMLEEARRGPDGIFLNDLDSALRADGRYLDHGLCVPVTFSQCGWGLDRFGPGWVGWAGAGGSMLLFNPDLQVTFCYMLSRLEGRLAHKKGEAFIVAIEADLAS